MAGDELEGTWLDRDFKLLGNSGELCFDFFGGDPAKIKPLASAEDGGKDFMGLGGGKKEDHMGGRLFERFKKGVKTLLW